MACNLLYVVKKNVGNNKLFIKKLGVKMKSVCTKNLRVKRSENDFLRKVE